MGATRPPAISLSGNFDRDLVLLIPALRSFSCRFCNAADQRDDLVQETLERALRFRQQFSPGTRLKSWLFTIMRNAFLNRVEKAKRDARMLFDDYDYAPSSNCNQEMAITALEVRERIAELPPEFRTALLLVAQGGSYNEAAEICCCELGTIKSRVSRARATISHDFPDLFS